MNLVVFSKDRACQLHAFLTSFGRHVAGAELPNVLYTTSAARFELGYMRLTELIPQAKLFPERADFKTDLLALIDPAVEYTCFFVDDIVFRIPFSFDPQTLSVLDDDEVLCLSLRLSPFIDFTFSMDRATPAPVTAGGTWAWRECLGDWGYPMSLDGHVFRTADILPAIQERQFTNPNLLEARLFGDPIDRPLMACLDDNPVVNIPTNRVQTSFDNRHLDGPTAEDLNDAFLGGSMIDITALDGVRNRSAHHDTDLQLVPITP